MSDEAVYDFGMRLKELRKRKRLSQADIARRLDITPKTVYRYENNTLTPSLGTAMQLAIILNTSLDYLTGLSDDPVISVHGHSKEQVRTLFDIIEYFIEK